MKDNPIDDSTATAFLEGIDERFQRLAKLQENGRRTGIRSSQELKNDGLAGQMVAEMKGLSVAQQQEVLQFIRSLRSRAK